MGRMMGLEPTTTEITTRVLYPTELQAHKKSLLGSLLLKKSGRSDRIRTYDPLVPNQVHYQAVLHSECLTRLYYLRKVNNQVVNIAKWCV